MIEMIQAILYKEDNCRPLAILTVYSIKSGHKSGRKPGNISDQPDRRRPAARQTTIRPFKTLHIPPISMCTTQPSRHFSLVYCLFSLLISQHTQRRGNTPPSSSSRIRRCHFHLLCAFSLPSVRRSLRQLAEMRYVVCMLAYSTFEI